MAGRLYAGTSGFSYAAWAPAFYPSGTRSDALLDAYASRLDACELNNTFYRQPSPERIAAWTGQTPAHFRFSVKALRTGSLRAYHSDPRGTLEWLTAPLAAFGDRLGAVLFRIPSVAERDDQRLDALLAAWPESLPLVLELQHPSWQDDAVHARLRAAGAVLCHTDLETVMEPRTMRVTGGFLYLRLRRDDYAATELEAWAARLEPFLADGRDVYVFFKHDAVGRAGLLALDLAGRLAAYRPTGRPDPAP
jgi:uncharacterized protein YecE (DUF72 family)